MKTVKKVAVSLLRKRWPFRLIGVALFILILSRVDLQQVWQTLLRVDLTWIFLGFVLQFLALGIAAVRWQLIMRRLDIRIPFWRTLLHQVIGTGAALMTPGQVGEFVKVLYHRNEGVPIAESIFSVVVDRLYDLATLFLLGLLALAILFGLPFHISVLLGVGAVLTVLFGFLLTRKGEQSRRWLITQLVRVSPKSYEQTMRTEASRLTAHLAYFSLDFLLLAGLLTVANYVLLVVRAYTVVLAIDLAVPFWYYAMIVPLIRLVGLVPISILGIGTRDITVIYLLGQVGISQESALLVSVLGLIMRPVQAFLGLATSWLYPLYKQEEALSNSLLSPKRSVTERGRG